jgi:hypothetical protein
MKVILYLFLLLFTITASAQIATPSYTLIPLKAKYIDSTNPKEIILIFKHATKSNQQEKLIISGKLTYSLGNGNEKTETLGQRTNAHHTIAIFGKDINEKNQDIYNLIADKVDLTAPGDFRFLVFYLRNLTDKYVDKMTFTYGLWEPADENVRLETKYEIKIDK